MKKVILVHALDTEGPLYESLDHQFDRIEEIFGVKNLKRTKKIFKNCYKIK